MRVRRISYAAVVAKVAELCQQANFYLPEDIKNLIKSAENKEISGLGKMVCEKILKNAKVASEEKIPLCQDCGTAVVFAELGENVKIIGGNLKDAINEGVAKGYQKGYLRKSMCHPLTRKNTGDNTPAVIHIDIVLGNELRLMMMPKGGGSENVAKLKMLSPSAGKNEIVEFVVSCVKEAGSNPCPPVIVGVGIGGGSAERAMYLAKKALLSNPRFYSSCEEIASLEKEILEKINKLGIGPQGLGGRITALSVVVVIEPCHIASLPAAVNLNCHSARRAEAIL